MPEPYDIANLSLPADSEIPALLATFPEAVALRFGDEELLVRAWDPGHEFFRLRRGTCIVEMAPPEPEESDEPSRRRPGNELFTLTATPAHPLFVGEMACFGDGLRSASVRSSMNSVAVRFEPGTLHHILENFPRLTRTLCEQFSARLIDLNEQLRRHRQQLLMKAEQVFFEAGTVLFCEGEEAELLFQLVDGSVALSHADGGEEMLRPMGGKPVFIEPIPYLTAAPHERTATARSMVIAVSIASQSRDAVVRNFPHLTLELLRHATAKPQSSPGSP